MQKDIFHAIGVMSGTSLDGVDMVYVQFNNEQFHSFKIISAATVPYAKDWKLKLKQAYSTKNLSNQLDVTYGNFLGELIDDFIQENTITEVDFIASHGHTIFHKPEKGYTLQIGDGQQIADKIGCKVICDFRTQDVALGGQGAPLVPIGDRLLFGDYDYCLNLGGFANISYEEGDRRIAYDICPVNIVLNHYVHKLSHEYDDRGYIAAGGQINQKLLQNLNELPFYDLKPPKSLGLEWVESTIFPLIDSFKLEVKDILRTFVEHIAIQICSQFQVSKTSVLVTGGGAFNDFLVSRLSQLTTTKICIPEREIIEYKEALIFALLGLLKSQNKVNVLSSVTGAQKDHSSGKIFEPKG